MPLVKLKPGPGQSRDEVSASQQARIRQALVELVAEIGYPAVTVRRLLRTSGVSSRTFYAHFANLEDCFASTYRSIVRSAVADLERAAACSPNPRQGLHAGLTIVLERIAADPRPAHLALIDSFDVGPAMLKEMAAASRDLEPFLTSCVGGEPWTEPPAALLGQGIVVGVERPLRRALLSGRHAGLPSRAEAIAKWTVAFRDTDVSGLWAAGEAIDAAAPQIEPEAPGGLDEESWIELQAVKGDRGRILAAAGRLAATIGRGSLTGPKIRREAGVSRRRFDSVFGGVDECVLEAIGMLIAAALRRAGREAGSAPVGQRICRIALALCSDLAARPGLAWLAFTEVSAFGAAGLRVFDDAVSTFAVQLRTATSWAGKGGKLGAEASAAAALSVIRAEVGAEGTASLLRCAPLVAHLILAPAMGDVEIARQEIENIHTNSLTA